MTTLTVPTVAAWRPVELLAAADRLTTAADGVDEDARVVRRHLGRAIDDAGGAWAAAAADRADEEARRGRVLADALRATAVVLRDGVARLAHARERLLDAVDVARGAGFEVTAEGRVPAPVSVAPLDQLTLTPEHRSAERLAAERCAALEDAVLAALADVAAVDEAVAGAVADVELPTTLTSVLEAHRVRSVLHGGDHVAALGAAGGAVVAARAVTEGGTLLVEGRRLVRCASLWGRGAPGPVFEEARRALAFGTSSSPALKVAGRVSLPTTLVTGVHDAISGGGHEGARGWATRGFGAAGAAGAGVVLAGAVVAPGLVVAGGAAVVAYGAWSAGTYVVDHWDQVEDAFDAADEWVDRQWLEAGAEVDDAVDWAHERLVSPAAGALDAVGELF